MSVGQSKLDKVLAEAREYKAKREEGYREKALNLSPFSYQVLSDFCTDICKETWQPWAPVFP